MTTPTSPDIRLLHGLPVPLRDGVRLSADVYVPAAAGPFPTIVTRTPYESGRDVFIELGVWWAERGYAFAVQDCRGRFESEGTFHAYFPDIEDDNQVNPLEPMSGVISKNDNIESVDADTSIASEAS